MFLIAFVIVLVAGGCKDNSDNTGDKVVILSPHSDNIKYEIERGFKAHYLKKYGKEVTIDWRNIGGGGSAILGYIRNVYSRSDSSGIDIFYGAGQTPHQYLAEEGLLEVYLPQQDFLDAVPEVFSGSRLYDQNHRWHGVVLSSFGFLYNKELLQQLNLDKPLVWNDLGRQPYHNHIMLADPSQSSSMAAAYEMILQSESDWQTGWEKLLNILANAKKFTSSSSTATNAPVIGEAVIAACIDYYGALAVIQAPNKLGYVSPKGGTGFSPDPISILKNPPHAEVAKRFLDYTLSFEGQALWGLKPGEPMGPENSCLNRSPIRKDFYEKYGDKMPQWLVKPYSSEPIEIDMTLCRNRYDVMIELVRAAAIDSGGDLSKVKKIIDTTTDQSLKDEFYRLPEEIDTIEKIATIHSKLSEDTYRQDIRRKWAQFYRNKYASIIDSSDN